MAHIYKEGKTWRAQIARAGVRASKTCRTKSAAEQWATAKEADILATHTGAIPKRTVTQALDRYEVEVSAKKKGHAWEVKRLAQFRRETWAAYLLADLSSRHLAEWRDFRLQHITSGAVRRDLTLLRHVMSTAHKEWGWLASSPFEKLTMPQDNKARTRRILPAEVKVMCRALGYVTGHVETKQQQVALAFLIALRTAMRAGEILSLTPADVDLQARVAHLSDSKNGDARDVPLSRAAVRLFGWWSGWTVTNASRDALFRKARIAAGLEGFTFHDGRAEALTRLSSKLDPFELARMSGHKDMDLLLKRYYRKTASQIAQKL